MRTFVVLTFLSIAGVFPPALAATPPASDLTLGLSLYGNSAESIHTQSRIAGTELEARFRRAFSTEVTSEVAASVQIETGAARARWADDFRPKQILRLRQARLNWEPASGLAFSVGALDQTFWKTPLLLQRQTFPAALEHLQVSFGTVSVSLTAQQAVAADTSSLQPWGNWAAGMPAFYMERLGLKWEPTERLRFDVWASHYLFENLSTPAAFQSQFLGNSIVGTNPSNSAYLYGFQGFEWAAGVSGRIGNWKPSLNAVLLRNDSAPAGRSVGWRLAVGAEWALGNRFAIEPTFEFFRMESDVVPAFYNDRVFGHANRDGFGVGLSARWPDSGVSGAVRWVHSGVISTNPFQSPLDWISVAVSTTYDVL